MSEQLEDLLNLKRRIAERVEKTLHESGNTRSSLAEKKYRELGLKNPTTAYLYICNLARKGDYVCCDEKGITIKRLEKIIFYLKTIGVPEEDPLIRDINDNVERLSRFEEAKQPLDYSRNGALNSKTKITRGGFIVPATKKEDLRFYYLLDRVEALYPKRATEEYLQGMIERYDKGNTHERQKIISELEEVVQAHK